MKDYKIPVIDDYDTVVVGAGVVGLACAMTLAKAGYAVVVCEESPPQGKPGHVDKAQSVRNSGVIHAGIYYSVGSHKARLCAQGRQLLYDFCRVHDVPCMKTGKLVVATTAPELKELEALVRLARKNGIRSIEMLIGSDLHRRMPLVNGSSGIYVPHTGIIDAAAYRDVLKKECIRLGVVIQNYTRVIAVPEIRVAQERITVRITQRAPGMMDPIIDIRVRNMVNAAGLDAARVAQMVNETNPWQLDKVRGEYVSFDAYSRGDLKLNAMPVYGPPRRYQGVDGLIHTTLGVHTTPTIDGVRSSNGKWQVSQKVLIGPTARPVQHVDDERLDVYHLKVEEVIAPLQRIIPQLSAQDCQFEQIGIQARGAWSDQDFVVEQDPVYPWCTHLIGIDSPGLTASLAIGEEVVERWK